MSSISDNAVILQLQTLLESAIILKEKFDKNSSIDAIEAYTERYIQEFDKLRQVIPKEVIERGRLLQHSLWLKSNVQKRKPENSYSDIKDICLTDIFLTEVYYLRYLEEAQRPEEKLYGWNLIHPTILKIAKSRFESSHFADAVEASFKELNDMIKQHYKAKNNTELDGDALMRKSFTSSPNNNFEPLFKLADNTTESGKNVQQGYMDIFAGVMRGIRNPKSHANLDVNPDEAWEMIVLASHLFRMWEKFN